MLGRHRNKMEQIHRKRPIGAFVVVTAPRVPFVTLLNSNLFVKLR